MIIPITRKYHHRYHNSTIDAKYAVIQIVCQTLRMEFITIMLNLQSNWTAILYVLYPFNASDQLNVLILFDIKLFTKLFNKIFTWLIANQYEWYDLYRIYFQTRKININFLSNILYRITSYVLKSWLIIIISLLWRNIRKCFPKSLTNSGNKH